MQVRLRSRARLLLALALALSPLDLFPESLDAELGRPAFDVAGVEIFSLVLQNSQYVAQLSLGLSRHRPLELGEHRILRAGDVHRGSANAGR